MMKEKAQLEIKRLLELNSSGEIKPDDKAKLLDYLHQYWQLEETDLNVLDRQNNPHEADFFMDYMEQIWEDVFRQKVIRRTLPGNAQGQQVVDWEQMYQQIIDSEPIRQIASVQLKDLQGAADQNKPATLRKRVLGFKWAAASIIVIALGLSGWWFAKRPANTRQTSILKSTQDLSAPSSAKALLVLADGSQVILDSASSGLVAREGSTNVLLNSKNALTYDQKTGTGVESGNLQFNELRVLKGSQPVSVRLSDGSNVWLNVGSSLRYPTIFAADQREVTLNGEAYFEVNHAAKRPFVVHHGNVAIKVLGTHFNIKSYADEPDLKVTLVQGVVEVSDKGQNLLLHPGEQAIAKNGNDGSLTLNTHVDLEQVLSWRSSEFVFGQATDFDAIMRQIARWYDVEVSYTGTISTQFWGSVPRSASILEVLHILEATGGVRFDLEGRHLKVIAVK